MTMCQSGTAFSLPLAGTSVWHRGKNAKSGQHMETAWDASSVLGYQGKKPKGCRGSILSVNLF